MTRRLVADAAGHALSVARSTARSGAIVWAACCAGREPAESLDPRDREDLVAELAARSWTLTEIAVLTRMSTYTTARIATRAAQPVEIERAA